MPADSGKKGKKGRKKGSEMLHCTICVMSRLLDNTRKVDKQKGFSDVSSNLLQQIG